MLSIYLVIKISVFFYWKRTGTEEIFEKSKSSAIPTISIVNHLISKRKANDERLRKQYLALNQPDKLKIKTFRIFRRNGENLRTLVAKTRRKIRLNKKQQALFKQRTLTLVNTGAPRRGKQVFCSEARSCNSCINYCIYVTAPQCFNIASFVFVLN